MQNRISLEYNFHFSSLSISEAIHLSVVECHFYYFCELSAHVFYLFFFFYRNIKVSPSIFKSSLYIRIINDFCVLRIANIFSHVTLCLWLCLSWFLAHKRWFAFCLVFKQTDLFICVFSLHLNFRVIVRKIFSESRSKRDPPRFSLVLVWFHFLQFWLLIHLDFFLGYGLMNRTNFTFF